MPMNLPTSRRRTGLLVYQVLLLFIYFIAASQAVQSFAYKWTTIVDHKQYSLEQVLSGESPRPYAYRLLMPTLVANLTDRLPSGVAQVVLERSRATLEANLGEQAEVMSDRTATAYGLILQLNFAFLVLTMLLLRSLALRVIGTPLERHPLVADVAPLLFALLLAVSYRKSNGFIYDAFELLILSGYLWAVATKRQSLALLALVPAILNKETAVFYPLLGAALSGRTPLRFWQPPVWRGFLAQAAVVAIGFATVRYALRDHPGAVAEWHAWGNLEFWLSPSTYALVATPHLMVIPLPRVSNILVLVPLLCSIFAYWQGKPEPIRRGLLTAAAINLPLFFLLCWRDEFRNLSLLFPFLFLAATHSLAMFSEEARAGDRSGMTAPEVAAASSDDK